MNRNSPYLTHALAYSYEFITFESPILILYLLIFFILICVATFLFLDIPFLF